MFSLKYSVDPRGLKPEAVPILIVAAQVYEELGYDCVVTSISDSKHTAKSLHGLGYAVDLRTKNVPQELHEKIRATIQERLNNMYQCVLETDHVHCEFDPRAVLAQ